MSLVWRERAGRRTPCFGGGACSWRCVFARGLLEVQQSCDSLMARTAPLALAHGLPGTFRRWLRRCLRAYVSILPPSSSIGALGPSMALGSCGGGRSRARGTGRRATWNRRGFPRCATRGEGGAGAADERVELVKGLGDLLDLEPDLREIGVGARDPKGRKFSESAFVGGSTRDVLQIVVGDHNLPLIQPTDPPPHESHKLLASSQRGKRADRGRSSDTDGYRESSELAGKAQDQRTIRRWREEERSNHNPRTRREG